MTDQENHTFWFTKVPRSRGSRQCFNMGTLLDVRNNLMMDHKNYTFRFTKTDDPRASVTECSQSSLLWAECELSSESKTHPDTCESTGVIESGCSCIVGAWPKFIDSENRSGNIIG